jgi:hypothetical protein
MKSSRLVVLITASSLALPMAHGQTPEAPDALCAGIAHVVKTANEARPFISLVPAGQSLGMLPRLNQSPSGFADFTACELYRAGNAKEGVNGGGPFNYVRCNMLQETSAQNMWDKAAAAKAAAAAAYDKLAVRAKACLEPQGWAAAGGERVRNYEDYETALIFSRPDSLNSVVVSLVEDNSSPSARTASVSWSVNLAVRNPNPGHPMPE